MGRFVEIDFLFFGAINSRRSNIINQLKNKGYNAIHYPHFCANCRSVSNKSCPCLKVNYCDEICQREHWERVHREEHNREERHSAMGRNIKPTGFGGYTVRKEDLWRLLAVFQSVYTLTSPIALPMHICTYENILLTPRLYLSARG